MAEQKGGFAQIVSFVTKDGHQSFEEIGDDVKTVVQTRGNLYRHATIHKIDKKKQVCRLTFRRGVYANTDTIIYAALDQEWPLEDRKTIKRTDELRLGDKLQCVDGIVPRWEIIGIEPPEEEVDVWSVEVDDGDSFVLRNTIPTMSLEVGEADD